MKGLEKLPDLYDRTSDVALSKGIFIFFLVYQLHKDTDKHH